MISLHKYPLRPLWNDFVPILPAIICIAKNRLSGMMENTKGSQQTVFDTSTKTCFCSSIIIIYFVYCNTFVTIIFQYISIFCILLRLILKKHTKYAFGRINPAEFRKEFPWNSFQLMKKSLSDNRLFLFRKITFRGVKYSFEKIAVMFCRTGIFAPIWT